MVFFSFLGAHAIIPLAACTESTLLSQLIELNGVIKDDNNVLKDFCITPTINILGNAYNIPASGVSLSSYADETPSLLKFFVGLEVSGSTTNTSLGKIETFLSYSKNPEELLKILFEGATPQTTDNTLSPLKSLTIYPQARFTFSQSFKNIVEYKISAMPYVQLPVDFLKNYLLGGMSAKVKIWDPNEGVSVYGFGSYNLSYLNLNFDSIVFIMQTHTITPGLLIAKNLRWCIPFLGVQTPYVTGTTYLDISGIVDAYLQKVQLENGITIPLPSIKPFQSTASTFAYEFFMGFHLHVSYIPLSLHFMGSFHSLGFHTLATQIGLQF